MGRESSSSKLQIYFIDSTADLPCPCHGENGQEEKYAMDPCPGPSLRDVVQWVVWALWEGAQTPLVDPENHASLTSTVIS